MVALTGAGMSAESGIPTFRGADGLWRNFNAQQLATPEAFERDPMLVWEWYDWRRGLIAAAEPNAGHRALAGMRIVTQNVDGLHTRAGSTEVIEIHGSIWQLRCTGCRCEVQDLRPTLAPLPPTCEECGRMLRPGVVWFGENLRPRAWEMSVEWVSEADVLLVIGTSGVVYPAAQLAPIAREAGAKIVEINIEETALSGLADACFLEPSGQILPKLVQ